MPARDPSRGVLRGERHLSEAAVDLFAQTDPTRVLVLGDDRAEFGVLADAAHDITTLRVDEIHAAPDSATGVGREYLRGVTADALIVLDGAALLQDGRLFIDQGDESGA